MREAINLIGAAVGSLLLIPLAIVIIAFITPFAFVWLIIKTIRDDKRKAREILTGMAKFFLSIASSIDKFGNCAFGGFLTDLLLIEGKYPFGENYETVSEVMGWAEKYPDLNRKGLFLLATLNMFDKDHCRRAMDEGVARARKKLELYAQLGLT